jgi:hypothetical protein
MQTSARASLGRSGPQSFHQTGDAEGGEDEGPDDQVLGRQNADLDEFDNVVQESPRLEGLGTPSEGSRDGAFDATP